MAGMAGGPSPAPTHPHLLVDRDIGCGHPPVRATVARVQGLGLGRGAGASEGEMLAWAQGATSQTCLAVAQAGRRLGTYMRSSSQAGVWCEALTRRVHGMHMASGRCGG
jgi:hypothetical protein